MTIQDDQAVDASGGVAVSGEYAAGDLGPPGRTPTYGTPTGPDAYDIDLDTPSPSNSVNRVTYDTRARPFTRCSLILTD